MTSRDFVDTNVWIYAVDRDEPEKRGMARTFLEVHSEALVISTQVLQEFYVVATRKLRRPLSEERAGARVEQMAQLPLVTVDVPAVRSAITTSRTT